jgi:hypothetical protein
MRMPSVQERLAAGLKAILPIAVTQRLQARSAIGFFCNVGFFIVD